MVQAAIFSADGELRICVVATSPTPYARVRGALRQRVDLRDADDAGERRGVQAHVVDPFGSSTSAAAARVFR